MSIYCVYLTVYHGNKLPPFYIGYSTVKKVLNGYHGTVSSKQYKSIYKQELEYNPHLFKTFIISKCVTQKEALTRESYFQRHFNVHTNPMYMNRAITNEKFYCTDHSYKKTESYSQKVSENNRRRWSDPVEREILTLSIKKTKSTESYRKKQSVISRRLANDPEYVSKLKNGVKKSWGKEGERERRSLIMRESYINNPQFSEKKKLKKWWTNGTVSVHSEICPPGYYRGRVTPWQTKPQS